MGSQLIGAVHLANPFSHTTGHLGGISHHMDHMHGQSGPLSQTTENIGVSRMAQGGLGSKGGYLGGTRFGFNPYARTEASSKLQASPAWENQVSMPEHQGQVAGALPYGTPQGGPHALEDLEVTHLNAFLESMDSEARADLMNGQHFQHCPQSAAHAVASFGQI